MLRSIVNHSNAKSVHVVSLAGTLIVCFLAMAASPAISQESAGTNKVIPLIVMDDVKLQDAIRNLARMAGINYILDPKISFSGVVSGRWEKLTAEQALEKLLDERKLKVTPNPATSVARVTSSNTVTKPVTLSQVEKNTNNIVPIFVVDEARLDDTVRRLGAMANLKISFEPDLSEKALGQSLTFRWENLTPKQALAALLDNYDLDVVEEPSSGTARVVPKKQAADTSSSTTK